MNEDVIAALHAVLARTQQRRTRPLTNDEIAREDWLEGIAERRKEDKEHGTDRDGDIAADRAERLADRMWD